MFLINLQGKDSIYEQIRSQIEKFIKSGILKPDDKLPSVRSLAEDLGINPNTVMKAYQELEKNGYIYTVNKKGVFVSKDLDVKKKQNRKDAIYMFNTLKAEGFSKDDLQEILNEVFNEEETC
ncbi:MAG: GntR family transcriptional regulator [Erysipelotrichaceae bacterium]|nr:GntR family transcriptional regulator [Erysipelotrichaceae bacterium]